MNSSKTSCAAWCSMNGCSAGLFIIRLFVGALFVWQGGHKLFGGMDGFTGMVTLLHFPAPAFFAWVAALVEFFGGLMIVFGGGIRVASMFLLVDMLIAFFGAHHHSLQAGGMPSFILIGCTLGFIFSGAGAWNNCRKMGMKGHSWLCGCGSSCGGNEKDCCSGGGCCGEKEHKH